MELSEQDNSGTDNTNKPAKTTVSRYNNYSNLLREAIKMKVEISYFPPEKIITEPGEEATYPFEINGEFQYIVEFSLVSMGSE
ncbi:hypothetical protein [Peribacillus sp. Bi134]|uniref:hypothetical protein n=1 Tax=Peribacillus sp. Bi134 TaxID=2884272 RepID=UPI001D6502FE|nr:hypothetical protein [Peribacillus sp. Bi134]CAH0123463.1 hypothetical protein SRABI134_00002 [Peribacillus sp. Bi134]